MEVNYKEMDRWESEKAVFLQKTAIELGMDVSGKGTVDVSPNSGYVYLWLEDYSFTLYMPISCELIKTNVSAIWSNPQDGEEMEFNLRKPTTLRHLEEWAERLDKKFNKD